MSLSYEKFTRIDPVMRLSPNSSGGCSSSDCGLGVEAALCAARYSQGKIIF